VFGFPSEKLAEKSRQRIQLQCVQQLQSSGQTFKKLESIFQDLENQVFY